MCLAVPAKIIEIDNNMAVADFGSVSRRISLGIIENAQPGDYVLVHAGFAIGKVSKQEAQDTIRAMEELREAFDH